MHEDKIKAEEIAESITDETKETADPIPEICFTQEEMLKSMKLLEEKDKLLEEMGDRYKRLQADFENFRRRTRLEKEELSQVVTESVVAKLLPVIDNFERARSGGTEQDAASILAGVEMIYRQLITTFEKMDVKPIEAVGTAFDPKLHEAVMSVADDNSPDGSILEEFQKGYTIGTKVIRPSMVKVVTNS